MLPLDDLMIIGTENPEGYVYAFDRDSCHVRWKRFCGPGVYADVVGDSERVFAVTLQDSVLCLQPQTGRLYWAFTSGDTTGISANKLSPVLVDSLLLYVDRAGTLFALRAATGAVAWQRSFSNPINTSLHFCAGSVYFRAPPGYYRVDPATGDVRSSTDSFRVVSPYGVDCCAEGLVAFSDDSTAFHLAAIDHELRHVLWRKSPPEGSRWTSLRPVAWRGFAIAGTDSGDVLGYRVTDGTAAWKRRVKGVVKIFGTETNRLYVGTQSGAIYAFDP